MEDIQLKLSNIRSTIRAFKDEQEAFILRETSTSKAQQSGRRSSSNSASSSKKTLHPVSDNKSSDEGLVNQILQLDAVIMPVSNTSAQDQRLWPQALIAKHNDHSVAIGNIESHGTLWKLVLKQDGYAGHRVYVQSSEIGEEVRYLSAALTLVSKSDAAVWNVRKVVCPKDKTALPIPQDAATKGVFVALELADAAYQASLPMMASLSESYSPTSSKDLAAYPKILPTAPLVPSLLTCCTSSLSADIELMLPSLQYLKDQQAKGTP